MYIDARKILDDVMSRMHSISQLNSNDIPSIDLYMDQVTTFMDEKLASTMRSSDKDKEEHVLTKTMINNYAKNDLLPPPLKKKYTKEHMMVLIFIYYFKSHLSISDIKVLLDPITKEHFNSESSLPMKDIYEIIVGSGDKGLNVLGDDLIHKYEESSKLFEKFDTADREYLQLFSFVCYLSYDIHVKQMLVESIVDEIAGKNIEDAEIKKAKEKAEKKKKG